VKDLTASGSAEHGGAIDVGRNHRDPGATLPGFLSLLWDVAWETFATILAALIAIVAAYMVFCVTPELIHLIGLRMRAPWGSCPTGEVVSFMNTKIAVDDLMNITGALYFSVWFAGFYCASWCLVNRWRQARRG
jgi:hypothetical protein